MTPKAYTSARQGRGGQRRQVCASARHGVAPTLLLAVWLPAELGMAGAAAKPARGWGAPAALVRMPSVMSSGGLHNRLCGCGCGWVGGGWWWWWWWWWWGGGGTLMHTTAGMCSSGCSLVGMPSVTSSGGLCGQGERRTLGTTSTTEGAKVMQRLLACTRAKPRQEGGLGDDRDARRAAAPPSATIPTARPPPRPRTYTLRSPGCGCAGSRRCTRGSAQSPPPASRNNKFQLQAPRR